MNKTEKRASLKHIQDMNRKSLADFLNSCPPSDPGIFLKSLGEVVCIKGYDNIATSSGLGSTSMYKSLSGHKKPRYDTIARILTSLGLEIKISPIKNRKMIWNLMHDK